MKPGFVLVGTIQRQAVRARSGSQARMTNVYKRPSWYGKRDFTLK